MRLAPLDRVARIAIPARLISLGREARVAFRKKVEELRRAAPSPAMSNGAPRKVPGVQDRRAETLQRALAK